MSPSDFGALFKAFLEQATHSAEEETAADAFFRRRLQDHFGRDPSRLPTVSEPVENADHQNLHGAMETYLAGPGRSAELVGILGGEGYGQPSIAELLEARHGGDPPEEGPVQYASLPLADGGMLACVSRGLYLVADGERRAAVLIARPAQRTPWTKLTIDAMAPDRDDAVQLLRELRTIMRASNIYRGHVISLHADDSRSIEVRFHRLPAITRDDIVLPGPVLARIERHTIGFSRHRDRLLQAGRHLKRGILLYGPPGTGKTLTAMYLAAHMADRTTLLLTGRGHRLLRQSCAMARLLEPATVILEDVNLVAERRTSDNACSVVLFDLLDEMDGLASDADVLFLLTTNRPEALEPALASRPGRVNLAVEVPLPDADCRRRLFDLYARGLTLRLEDPDGAIARTEGVSAAFIRELFRKATLLAADENSTTVDDRHVDAAIRELVVEGGALTRSLLGAAGASPPAD